MTVHYATCYWQYAIATDVAPTRVAIEGDALADDGASRRLNQPCDLRGTALLACEENKTVQDTKDVKNLPRPSNSKRDAQCREARCKAERRHRRAPHNATATTHAAALERAMVPGVRQPGLRQARATGRVTAERFVRAP